MMGDLFHAEHCGEIDGILDEISLIRDAIASAREREKELVRRVDDLMRVSGLSDYTHNGLRARRVRKLVVLDSGLLHEVAPDLVEIEQVTTEIHHVDHDRLRVEWGSSGRAKLEKAVQEVEELKIERDRRKGAR